MLDVHLKQEWEKYGLQAGSGTPTDWIWPADGHLPIDCIQLTGTLH